MSDKQIILGGQTITIAAFGGAADESGKLIGARQFLAAKFGIELPKPAKGVVGPSMKDVKAQALALGHTAEEIKAVSKEYDASRSEFYSQSELFNGRMAADPTLRKSVRLSISKKSGECIGATTTYRKQRNGGGVNATLAAKVKQLEAMLALALAGKALPSA